MAANTQELKVGDITVAIDGTKILTNASKHSAMSHGHLEKQMDLAEEQIAQLMVKAEDADRTPLAPCGIGYLAPLGCHIARYASSLLLAKTRNIQRHSANITVQMGSY